MGCTRELSVEEDSGKDKSRRKCAKSLAEKRRRGRINSCLIQLKRLLLANQEEADDKAAKMDQADVLEKTVQYLRRLRRDDREELCSEKRSIVQADDKYMEGYMDCTNEIKSCLQEEDNRFTKLKVLEKIGKYSDAHSIYELSGEKFDQIDTNTLKPRHEHEKTRDMELSSASRYKTSQMSINDVQTFGSSSELEEHPVSPTTKKLRCLPLFLIVETGLKTPSNVTDEHVNKTDVSTHSQFDERAISAISSANMNMMEDYSNQKDDVWRPW